VLQRDFKSNGFHSETDLNQFLRIGIIINEHISTGMNAFVIDWGIFGTQVALHFVIHFDSSNCLQL